MEALYAKLYNKYEALKKKRLSELDEINKDQEVKFLNYVSAAEELIQHFKDENDRLRTQVGELRSEVASIRSSKDKECAEYQNLLMEERKKNKMLSEEVEALQHLQEQLSSHLKDVKNANKQLNISEIAQGYSFSLTWIRKAAGEEPELLYRVSTLGMFEMVAPEWMRSVLMFSTSMCPIFFERLARVIRGHH